MTRLLAALALFASLTPAIAGDCARGKASAAHHNVAPAVLDIASGDDRFGTLVTAVKAAGLVDALAADGPITVFAPTDEAFARIDPEVLSALLRPENREALQAVLTFHVVPAEVDAHAARRAGEAATLNGQHLEVRAAGDTLLVQNAIVTQADIRASNGIVHVIDTVLLPPDLKI